MNGGANCQVCDKTKARMTEKVLKAVMREDMLFGAETEAELEVLLGTRMERMRTENVRGADHVWRFGQRAD